MGPKSTGPFIDQLVSKFQSITGAKYDIDFPPMMIYSLPTPFYIDRPIDHDLMKKTICGGLRKLESCGVSFVAMPCNTAHAYFLKLQQCIKIPLLNIVSATLKRIPNETKKITLLATQPTLESMIYQKGLDDAKFHYVLNPSWQNLINDMINSIKTSGDLKFAIRLWESISNSLHKEQIDTLVLACTDLNVLLREVNSSFTIIDSSACLAEEAVRKWEQIKQK